MNFNLFRFKRVFLPLSFVCLAVFAGNSKAHAADPSDARLAESPASAPVKLQKTSIQGSANLARSMSIVPDVANRVVKPVPGEVTTAAVELSSLRSSQAVKTPADVNVASSTPSGTITAQQEVGPATTSPYGSSQSSPSGAPIQIQTSPQPVQTPAETQTTPQIQPTTPTTPTQTTPTTPDSTISQPLVSPGRATRSGSSYFGVGGNIGIGSGDTQLGQSSFALISKIGLRPSYSVRPSILFSDNVTILLPITYDFSFGEGPTNTLGFTAAPYVGIGAAISTGGGGDVALLLTGGVDVPISSQFTATAAVNATVTGEAAIGILLGVGYNFSGF